MRCKPILLLLLTLTLLAGAATARQHICLEGNGATSLNMPSAAPPIQDSYTDAGKNLIYKMVF